MTRTEFFKMLGAAPVSAVAMGAKQDGKRQLVALSFRESLRPESIEKIKAQLKPYEEEFNVKFIVLCEDTKVVPLI